jgi:hypothetical protein
MASTWGGTAIPDPTRYDKSRDYVGNQYVLSNGALQSDTVSTAYYLIDLEFADVTTAQRNTLVTKFTTYSSAALVITAVSGVSNETSENVIPIGGSLNVSRLPGGTQAYVISGQVRTV